MAQQPPPITDEQSEENFWLSCFFLRNLPANIPPQQLSSWVSETFQKQCTRIVYADEVTKDVCRSGSYLIELSSPTARSIFSRQGRGEHFFFNIRLHCEEVRSEQFAKKAFLAEPSFNPLQSPGGTLAGTVDHPMSPQTHHLPHIPQEESSLARRCLLLWQVEDHTFPVSMDTIMQLFQGCLGEAVKQTTTLVPNSRNTRDKMMIEFSSEESVGRVLKAFDPRARTLAVPVKLQAVKKRAGNFAKRCLSEAEHLATIDHTHNKKKDGRKKHPHNHHQYHIQSPVASIPQQRDFGFGRHSELQSPMPPPLFPEPVTKSQLGGLDPPINLESLMPRDGEAPIGDPSDPLGLSFMALGQSSSNNIRNESSFPSFNLPFVNYPDGPSQEDPACLLPLILDSSKEHDEPAPPWGGINSESQGLGQLWGGNNDASPDSNTYDAPGRLFELEQKLHATERENAALIEQAIIMEREMQTLKQEMSEKDLLIESLRNQLEEKDTLLTEPSV
eukprot:CAMPEP_0113645558 /NCGR_PEP_ID=MMETSP0017_2-20120614/24021_1 /TAXON_ID=2856 /ORGANISM="Cylindrotheca closterium" /LENGTH=501 /DNA_ID=CAMNT_0000557315 /DNA_START=16 /DNA_END=1517 /DNA_ORIENTATION=- /assembly_acc=CAM_ASM_000147